MRYFDRKGENMKLTMVTEWNGDKCYAISRLEDHRSRVESCIFQTQEYVLNKYGFVPVSYTILEHMVRFYIDER